MQECNLLGRVKSLNCQPTMVAVMNNNIDLTFLPLSHSAAVIQKF